MKKTALLLSLLTTSMISSATYAADQSAADQTAYVITLKDGAFSPNNIELPANERVILTVKNQTTAPAEFESSDLAREKVVAAGRQIKVPVGPLKAGSYTYVNDFHPETKGTITVK